MLKRIAPIIALAALSVPILAENQVEIDCKSGSVDSGSKLGSMTDADCKSNCETHCANATTLKDAEKCLAEGTLLGCLFSVSQVQDAETEDCITKQSANQQTAVVTKVKRASINKFGTGDVVKKVYLNIDVSDSSYIAHCKNDVRVGLSIEAFNEQTCAYSGTVSLKDTFSWDATEQHLVGDVASLFTGLYGGAGDVILFVEWASTDTDPRCGNMTFADSDVSFLVEYRSGYSPSVECNDLSDDCTGCLANGCNYCDWSGTVSVFLPDWLPDWDVINAAKDRNNAICGLNTALCRMALGKPNTCGATAHVVWGLFTAAVPALAIALLLRN